MRVARFAERGQTLPFWVMGILVALALTFFVGNYAGTVKNQIHAQNAADSAASAALGRDAAALNTTQTFLAAVDMQQLKVQDAEAAIPYLLGTSPCGPSNLLASSCITALQGAATDVANANKTLVNLQNTISNFAMNTTNTSLSPVVTPNSTMGQVTGLLSTATANSTIKSLFAPNGSNGCSVAVLTDCNYDYTTYLSIGANGLPTVDEYACKVATNNAWSFLHLPMKSYYSIGHTTATLAPLSSAYNTSTLGSALQTTSNLYPDATGSTATSLLANISALNINSQFFTAVAAPPPTVTRSTADVCPSLT
jgi:hypothetical protein